MKSAAPIFGLQDCPRLTRQGGRVFFTDTAGRRHALAKSPIIRAKEVLDDARFRDFSPPALAGLIRRKELFPIIRHNRRVIRVFLVALDDYMQRQTNAIAADRRWSKAV
jgi:hypothetical protein